MTDDLHTEIGKLHQHIQQVSNQVGKVHEGQERLHREHMALRERVDVLEKNVSRDIDNLAAHEREAEIYRGHLLEGFNRLADTITGLDSRFAKHAELEEQDRKEVIRGQATTIRSILLAAATFAGSAALVIWQLVGTA